MILRHELLGGPTEVNAERPHADPFDECGCEGHGSYCDKCRAKLAANDAWRQRVTMSPLAVVDPLACHICGIRRDQKGSKLCSAAHGPYITPEKKLPAGLTWCATCGAAKPPHPCQEIPIERFPAQAREFVECDDCAAKPGAPQLCDSCLTRRRELSSRLGP